MSAVPFLQRGHCIPDQEALASAHARWSGQDGPPSSLEVMSNWKFLAAGPRRNADACVLR